MKYFVLAVGCFFFMSCENSLKKPLTSKLEIEDIRMNLESDSTFADFYEESQKIREWMMESDLRQAQWGDITYQELKQYYDYIQSNDNDLGHKIAKEAEEEYARLFPGDREKADSIFEYWMGLKNSIKQYVDIKCVDFRKYKDGSGGDVVFQISPLKGEVEQLSCNYYFEYNENAVDVPRYFTQYMMGSVDVNEPFSQPTRVHDFNLLDVAEGEDLADFKSLSDKTHLVTEISSLVVNGKNLVEPLDAMPEVLIPYRYGEYKNNEYAYENVICSLINPDYQSLFSYTYDKYKEAVRTELPKVYEFVQAFDHRLR